MNVLTNDTVISADPVHDIVNAGYSGNDTVTSRGGSRKIMSV